MARVNPQWLVAVEIPLGFLALAYLIRRIIKGAEHRGERFLGLQDALLEVDEDKLLPEVRDLRRDLLVAVHSARNGHLGVGHALGGRQQKQGAEQEAEQS